MTAPRFPPLRLPPSFDANVYHIAAEVCRCMREAGMSTREVGAFVRQISEPQTYAARVALCARWIVLDDWLAEQDDELREAVEEAAAALASEVV